MKIRNAAVALCAASTLAACSSSQEAASKSEAEAKNAVSPIVGSWQINGDVPAPEADLPQFVRLTFTTGGKLAASYVAAGGALAKVIGTPSKLKRESDSYTLDGKSHLRIVEGSRSLEYTWDVRDGKLFLTRKGENDAVVYQKADS